MRLISGEEEAALGFQGALSARRRLRWENRRSWWTSGAARRSSSSASVRRPRSRSRCRSAPTAPRSVSWRSDPPEDEELEALREHVGRDAAGLGHRRGAGRGGRRVGAGDPQDHARHAHGGAAAEAVRGGPDAVPPGCWRGSTGSRRSGRGCCRRRSPRSRRYWSTSARRSLTVARGGIREGTLLALAEGEEI